MTQIVFVLSPVVLINAISLIKFCVSRFARYQEVKLLRNKGVEYAVVAKDYIRF